MPGPPPKTIVLGFDGIDAALTQALIAAGRLPNLAAMARDGGFRRVLSTTPAESAVAWTSFTMGRNPGETNMFDFVGRLPGSYAPHLSGVSVHMRAVAPSVAWRWSAAGAAGVACGAGTSALRRRWATRREPARTVSRRGWLKGVGASVAAAAAAVTAVGVPWARWLPARTERVQSTIVGVPWWDRLRAAGQRSVALRIPLTFPTRAADGVRLLAGLGVPDLAGTNGTYHLLTDRADASGAGAHELRLTWADDRCHVRMPGPDDPFGEGPAFAEIRLRRDRAGGLSVAVGDEVHSLAVGRWSPPVPVRFTFSPLCHQAGLVRFYRCDTVGGTTLYVTPVEPDPRSPPLENPISAPVSYARDLSAGVGPFRTIGWETQTWGLVDGVLDEAGYLADVDGAIDLNVAQLDWHLARDDWDNLMLVCQATDQVQHMFFDDRAVAMRAGAAEVADDHPLVRVYRRVDEVVGRVRAAAARLGDARVVVMSDHGFAPYRRAVNVNTWLAAKGWLALKDRGRRDPAAAAAVLAGQSWENVDWFNTRAYGLGLAGIFLNVAGREPGGIVKRGDEYEFLQERLAAALLEWTDPQTGRPVLAAVYRRQDIYSGPHLDAAPDLILGFQEGYRVSSASAVGGIPEGELHNNAAHWCGDHCGIDAAAIPGVCFTSFRNEWPATIPIVELAGRIWHDMP